jgi:hypothetical protein
MKTSTMKTTKPLILEILAIVVALAVQVQAQSFLTNGLVAYYPLNGNANDASGNGNNGTITGGVFTNNQFGIANSAFAVSLLSDGILTPIQETNINTYTISGWFRTSLGGIIVGNSEFATNLILDVETVETAWPTSNVGQILWGTEASDYPPVIETTGNFADNNWHQVVGVFNAVPGPIVPPNFTIYIDGTNVSQITENGSGVHAPINSGTLSIGTDFVWNYYRATTSIVLSEIRIYNRALSSDEVAQLYAYESVPPPPPPFISNQPQSVLVNEHDSATFNVAATGTEPLAYQWFKNGANLPNATSSTLTITNVRPFNIGKYFVVVTNNYGSVTSSVAMLIINPNYANVSGPFLVASFSITLSEQSENTYKNGITTTANPTSVHLATTNILSALALDESLESNWPSNSFPRGSTLAVASGRFVVIQGTNFLVDVSDILTLNEYQPQITYGKITNATALALPSTYQVQIANVSFNDMSIGGGRNLQLYLGGVLTKIRTDTTPTRRKYMETQTLSLLSGAGNGYSNGYDVSFICTGSFLATATNSLMLP